MRQAIYFVQNNLEDKFIEAVDEEMVRRAINDDSPKLAKDVMRSVLDVYEKESFMFTSGISSEDIKIIRRMFLELDTPKEFMFANTVDEAINGFLICSVGFERAVENLSSKIYAEENS
jgi:hypothetical protein